MIEADNGPAGERRIGSIRPVILKQFLEFIEATPDELVQFMFSIDPTWDELEVELEVSNDE